MKKICLLLLMSVLFVFTACGSSNEKESEEEKTICGKWISPTYFLNKHGEKCFSDDPYAFSLEIESDQKFYFKSELDDVNLGGKLVKSYVSGSWSKNEENDNIEYYNLYVDGKTIYEMEFSKDQGSLLIKSVKGTFAVYYDNYSCKTSK